MKTNRAPDLTGAWIQRVESHDGTLTFHIEGIRRSGLLFSGKVIFEGIRKLEGFDPRLTTGTPVLRGGMTIRRQLSQPGETVFELARDTGPGDVDEPRFIISHESVTATLRLSLSPTVRAWVGFYPLARDRTYTR
jgi:hypothetical protein